MITAKTYSRQAPVPAATAQPSAEEATGFFGVEGIDDLLPQGMPYDIQIMVNGVTGIGKSVLAAQFLYEGLVTGDKCIYIACDDAPSNMRLYMAGFRLGTIAYERTGQLIIVDAYGRELSREQRVILDPSNLDEFFLYEKRVVDEALQSGQRVRLVVDSLSTIMATNSAADVINFAGHRLRYLRAARVLTLDNYVTGVLDERTLAGLAHAYPLIVRLDYHTVNGEMVRFLQLGKLKSGQFSASEHAFSIDPRTGIVMR